MGKLLASVLVIFKGKGFQTLKSLNITIGIMNNPLHYWIKGVTYLHVYLEPARAHRSKMSDYEDKVDNCYNHITFILLQIVAQVNESCRHYFGDESWKKQPNYKTLDIPESIIKEWILRK